MGDVLATEQDGAATVRRVVRVTITGTPSPTGFGNQQTVVEFAGNYPTHSLTTVHQAVDGTLWITNGDNAGWRDVDPYALQALQLDMDTARLWAQLNFLVPDDTSGARMNIEPRKELR